MASNRLADSTVDHSRTSDNGRITRTKGSPAFSLALTTAAIIPPATSATTAKMASNTAKTNGNHSDKATTRADPSATRRSSIFRRWLRKGRPLRVLYQYAHWRSGLPATTTLLPPAGVA